MKDTVFIHSNARQWVGAQVAQYVLKRNSAVPERFDVRILWAEDFAFLAQREGQPYLRDGKTAIWRNADLQSFPPLRFAVPGLMNYAGRALVTDPDVFAVGDVNELLGRDMGAAAVLARPASGEDRPGDGPHFASSVMLLDCARLRDWNVDKDFAALFAFERDYRAWMWLRLAPPGTVAPLEPVWNDFDRLEPDTRLLHNTRRRTQPWKTGLPADFVVYPTTLGSHLGVGFRRLKSRLTGNGAPYGHYRRHPDPAQEWFFFSMLAECLASGVVTAPQLQAEIARKHLRSDAFEMIDKARAKLAASRSAA